MKTTSATRTSAKSASGAIGCRASQMYSPIAAATAHTVVITFCPGCGTRLVTPSGVTATCCSARHTEPAASSAMAVHAIGTTHQVNISQVPICAP